MTPVFLKRTASIRASGHTPSGTILTKSTERKTAEDYLIKLANEPDNELRHFVFIERYGVPYFMRRNGGLAVSWPRLQNAYRILEMPQSKNNAAFIKTWRAKGACYPFYERDMIHSGRVKEIITKEALAKEMDLKAADPRDLRLYRDALRDPTIATKIREQMGEQCNRTSVIKRLLHSMRWMSHSTYILVLLVELWLGLAAAVYLRLLNYYVTVGALLGVFVLVVALL
ncbi:MAG: hypothetical protein Q9226_005049 [Calogaya cf. arnoldii]